MDEITVLSPATVANVVCGFDCLGFALEGPSDRMTVRKVDGREVSVSHTDNFGLTTDPARNVAAVAAQALIDAAGIDHGFEIMIDKQIRPGSGIGSSAASACGAVVAASKLIGEPFSKEELVEFAMAGEVVASGSRHADNLAPCIYGGFTLVRSHQPLDIVQLDHPELFVTILHPQIEIKTSEARAMLPTEVPLCHAVTNWSNLGAFVAALNMRDHDLLSRSMKDAIIEPARASLIPRLYDVKQASRDAGAIGGGISGSGPSMFMLSATHEKAAAVEMAMHDVYSTTGIDFRTYISKIDDRGVRSA